MTDAKTILSLPTRSGLQLHVRPAEESDETLLAAFFDKVSDEDRRFRFFSAVPHVGHEQLDPLIHADHFRSESILAFDGATGELVASGILACDNAMDTAEVAVSVRGDYKGRGVGWAVLDHLAGEAQKRGVRRVISIESRDNHGTIELEREKGFAVEPVEGDPTLVILARSFR
ncbi:MULTISPECIES: GNAT family N-acetyltransferase [Sphingobium]|jgi:GNAT superfamily N-acetyltransferase|uniref:Protein acetyltransferase n=2 Tax=Sphingobium fuliginis (strain ATCC 27551) TaxID=336203 RepID=A0A292ZLP3_SPHSA|nr:MULTISPECIES: GNAT family N-acetyltransferase [Sphingobium]OAP31634.1 GCN5 family acetyltransferase [Sphingobium sp. 20006FA]AJR23803.1 GCN5 family acetyltransferase [Sphingobium sp. YBL2]KXU32668.1 GCN5 family acetyltransferase [Sphingobium sp. AM]KYC32745.1 GCN5 family acetyltransferase [Sphingobium sp. 22B]MCB4858182.1 GNAT family N-acetyltransferase [Sphingobium sp. PNB]